MEGLLTAQIKITPFTQEEDDFLIENREKYSLSKLAIMLGRSKNSIVGRCHRLGAILTDEKRDEVYRENGKSRKKQIIGVNGEVFKPIKTTFKRHGRAAPMFMREPPVLILDGKGVIMGLLEPHHCKWVVGDPKNITCCGNDRQENSPYCAAHHQIAYAGKK